MEIRDKIRAYLTSDLLAGKVKALGDDQPLVSAGLVDSLGLVQLSVYLEEELGVYVPTGDVTPERFDTVAKIAATAVDYGAAV